MADVTPSPGVLIAPSAAGPVVEELRPLPEPWDVCRRLAHLPGMLFLDSALRHDDLGRHSFVTADPFAWIRARGSRTVTTLGRAPVGQCGHRNPFDVLSDVVGAHQMELVPGLPPFQGGIAGLFGYDLCHHLERLPRPRFDEFETSDLAVGIYDWVVAFDHAAERAWVISSGFPQSGKAGRQRAASRCRAVMCQLHDEGVAPARRRKSAQVKLAVAEPVPGLPRLRSSFDRAGYLAAVRRAIEYTHAGDCFQVNLAQRLVAVEPASPLDVYDRLRRVNAAPFAGYFDFGDFIIASASPERFVRVRDRHVDTRPIKGTRPRGATPLSDEASARDLISSPKDRAENVMIVDLLRNDLGRVCQFGSVEVAALCQLESYAHVHHLVSEVRGMLRAGLSPVDLLRAAFPGGSVTGAPKVRAMEIIAELEPVARGAYCGSLGYVGFDGSMDSSILIRTMTLGKGWAQFPVGGGIVADSVPESEYAETWDKAAGLLSALHV